MSADGNQRRGERTEARDSGLTPQTELSSPSLLQHQGALQPRREEEGPGAWGGFFRERERMEPCFEDLGLKLDHPKF